MLVTAKLLFSQNLKQETGERWGETVETHKIVETPGETCGCTMGNGRKWLGNWGKVTSREWP